MTALTTPLTSFSSSFAPGSRRSARQGRVTASTAVTADIAPTAVPRDRACVTAMRAGSEQAYLELVDRYSGEMLRFARCVVADDTAVEVVRDTWIEALRLLDRLDEGTEFKVWLFRILRATALARRGRQRRFAALYAWMTAGEDVRSADRAFVPAGEAGAGSWAEPPRSWGPGAVERLGSQPARAAIDAAIAELPDLMRQVLVLRDVEGWRPDEVSELLGVTDRGQRLLLHRARTLMRAALDTHLTPAEDGR